MTKKSGRKAKKKRERDRADSSASMQKSRLILMGITSILLMAYLAWRLGPTIGYVKAVLIGFGLAAVWVMFMMSSTILDWLRRR
jgi:Flp pilus assembly protein TadB